MYMSHGSGRQGEGAGITNPGIPGSEPLGGFMVDSASYPSEVDQMSTMISWGLDR